MQRRRFLKLGLFGSAALAAAGGSVWLLQQRTRLDAAAMPETQRILRAVTPALLAGIEPLPLETSVQKTTQAIAGLPAYTRAELGELMLLLSSAPGRWLAGVDSWDRLSAIQAAEFLQRWRTHRLQLLQAAYHALHDLVLGAWYADADAWTRIGYPGPPSL